MGNKLCNRRRALALAATLALGWRAAPVVHAQSASHTPSPHPASATPQGNISDELWTDAARQRTVPVRVRWPATAAPPPQGYPVVLFSHGLGGTRAGGELWGQAWAAADLVVVHLQHPGSDLDAVRDAAQSFANRRALRELAGPAQLLARLRDVGFVLDEITRRHATRQGHWASVRPQGIGLAGHSFGAHTTLGMAGQRYPGGTAIDEPRLAAFIALSPTLPAVGDATQAFERITRPTLSITGTRDDDVVGTGATPERRKAVYAALPTGRKAHLVLEDADHMSLAGQTGRATEILPRADIARQRQPTHHAVVAAVTTDWWLTWLMNDELAKARLARPSGLATGDLWQLQLP